MKKNRIKELRSLDVLTDDEMKELIQLSPSGKFKTGPNLFTIGVIDIDVFFENYKEASKHSQNAYNNGYYIETISIRLQYLEIFLRMYFVSKNKKNKVYDSNNDIKQFGVLINDCKTIGFDSYLISQLVEFNDGRKKAIHKLALGGIDKASLKQICDRSKNLSNKIITYVLAETGIPI